MVVRSLVNSSSENEGENKYKKMILKYRIASHKKGQRRITF